MLSGYMQFLVNCLPYYGEDCPFESICHSANGEDCPKTWNKYKICSERNPRECEHLKEVDLKEVKE